MTTAYIGIGSNEGDRMLNLARAVDALAEMPETHVEAVSHAYESEPAYVTDQTRFFNAVAVIDTALEAEQLLGYLQQTEQSLGRAVSDKHGPRVLDLDILLFGDEESVSDDLTIPHPMLLERDFVVTPLLEVAPHVRMPGGERIHRDRATVGTVLGDLGEIPDLGALHNEPVLAEDWVEVANSGRDQDVVAGWNAAIMLHREVLEEAGIPYAFDPYEPDAAMDPFGMPVVFKLLVPVSQADRAKRLLDEVAAARPEFPAEFEDSV
jgi:2-amino-4-hydroxy-6-hydroxymethyldihydropteridine diphosphokinase